MLGSLACYKEPLGSSSLMQSHKAVWFVTFLFATNAELNILARWRMCHTKKEKLMKTPPFERCCAHYRIKKVNPKRWFLPNLFWIHSVIILSHAPLLSKKATALSQHRPGWQRRECVSIITRRLSSQSPPERPWGGRERRKPNERDKAPGRTRHIPRSWDQSWRCRSATRWFSPRC